LIRFDYLCERSQFLQSNAVANGNVSATVTRTSEQLSLERSNAKSSNKQAKPQQISGIENGQSHNNLKSLER